MPCPTMVSRGSENCGRDIPGTHSRRRFTSVSVKQSTDRNFMSISLEFVILYRLLGLVNLMPFGLNPCLLIHLLQGRTAELNNDLRRHFER